MTDWDGRLLALAEHVASWSKDPSTKVGSVVASGKDVLGLGYNGFPKGVLDSPERLYDRQQKYPRVVHAEPNAILNARTDLRGCTLYSWPMAPCSSCAKLIIQAGIKRVVSPSSSEAMSRWGDDIELAQAMLLEAGVEVVLR